MARLWNAASEQWETVEDPLVPDAVRSGKYQLEDRPEYGLVTPNGYGRVPREFLLAALEQGQGKVRLASDEEMQRAEAPEGFIGQAAAAGIRSMGGASFGITDKWLDTMGKLVGNDQYIEGILEKNPEGAMLGEVAGFLPGIAGAPLKLAAKAAAGVGAAKTGAKLLGASEALGALSSGSVAEKAGMAVGDTLATALAGGAPGAAGVLRGGLAETAGRAADLAAQSAALTVVGAIGTSTYESEEIAANPGEYASALLGNALTSAAFGGVIGGVFSLPKLRTATEAKKYYDKLGALAGDKTADMLPTTWKDALERSTELSRLKGLGYSRADIERLVQTPEGQAELKTVSNAFDHLIDGKSAGELIGRNPDSAPVVFDRVANDSLEAAARVADEVDATVPRPTRTIEKVTEVPMFQERVLGRGEIELAHDGRVRRALVGEGGAVDLIDEAGQRLGSFSNLDDARAAVFGPPQRRVGGALPEAIAEQQSRVGALKAKLDELRAASEQSEGALGLATKEHQAQVEALQNSLDEANAALKDALAKKGSKPPAAEPVAPKAPAPKPAVPEPAAEGYTPEQVVEELQASAKGAKRADQSFYKSGKVTGGATAAKKGILSALEDFKTTAGEGVTPAASGFAMKGNRALVMFKPSGKNTPSKWVWYLIDGDTASRLGGTGRPSDVAASGFKEFAGEIAEKLGGAPRAAQAAEAVVEAAPEVVAAAPQVDAKAWAKGIQEAIEAAKDRVKNTEATLRELKKKAPTAETDLSGVLKNAEREHAAAQRELEAMASDTPTAAWTPGVRTERIQTVQQLEHVDTAAVAEAAKRILRNTGMAESSVGGAVRAVLGDAAETMPVGKVARLLQERNAFDAVTDPRNDTVRMALASALGQTTPVAAEVSRRAMIAAAAGRSAKMLRKAMEDAPKEGMPWKATKAALALGASVAVGDWTTSSIAGVLTGMGIMGASGVSRARNMSQVLGNPGVGRAMRRGVNELAWHISRGAMAARTTKYAKAFAAGTSVQYDRSYAPALTAGVASNLAGREVEDREEAARIVAQATPEQLADLAMVAAQEVSGSAPSATAAMVSKVEPVHQALVITLKDHPPIREPVFGPPIPIPIRTVEAIERTMSVALDPAAVAEAAAAGTLTSDMVRTGWLVHPEWMSRTVQEMSSELEQDSVTSAQHRVISMVSGMATSPYWANENRQSLQATYKQENNIQAPRTPASGARNRPSALTGERTENMSSSAERTATTPPGE